MKIVTRSADFVFGKDARYFTTSFDDEWEKQPGDPVDVQHSGTFCFQLPQIVFEQSSAVFQKEITRLRRLT